MAQPVRNRTAALALGAGAVVAGAFVVGALIHAGNERPSGTLRTTAPPVSIEASKPDPRIELLQAQIAGLNDRLAESERQAKAAREAQQAAEREPAHGEAAQEKHWTDGPAVNRGYDQRFKAQAVDGAWAVTESRSLRAFIDSSAPSARVETLECRSSMCRARVGFSSRKDRQAFVSSVTSPDFTAAAYVSTDADADKVTLFTARAGQDLPDVSGE